MRGLHSLSLRTTGEFLEVLDQRILPQEESWILIRSAEDLIFAFQSRTVRGASLLGVSAALALAQEGQLGAEPAKLREKSAALRETLPTSVHLMIALDRMNEVIDGDCTADRLVTKALELFEEDVLLCDRIAQNGVPLLGQGETILTLGNSGGLATAGHGTAFATFRMAHEQGRQIQLVVTETRPLLQGARLTAWECARVGLPHRLVTDGAAAWEMAQGRVQKVIVGAERIAANGDFANDVGTYSLAVLCHYHRIPFYVAAAFTTVDVFSSSGFEIPVEQNSPEEVRGVAGPFGKVAWAPEKVAVDNPSCDITPAELVRGWITDRGVFSFEDVAAGALLQNP